MPIKKTPRVNKTKEELAKQIAQVQKVEREKSLVKLMFPLLKDVKTIYDGQTALQALSGFIKAKLDQKTSEILVKDLELDFSKEEDTPIKKAVVALADMLEIEKAKDIAGLLERFGNILAVHGANEYMKQGMDKISIENIIAPDKK